VCEISIMHCQYAAFVRKRLLRYCSDLRAIAQCYLAPSLREAVAFWAMVAEVPGSRMISSAATAACLLPAALNRRPGRSLHRYSNLRIRTRFRSSMTVAMERTWSRVLRRVLSFCFESDNLAVALAS
jgi:hypothetical protein